jgi:hypothetical protein
MVFRQFLDFIRIFAEQREIICMKKRFLTLVFGLTSVLAFAQNTVEPFKGYLYNDQYEVYMKIDLYNESINVPGNELYGQLPGFLGKKNNSFCWPVTAAKIKDEKTAELSLINDYGSEDHTATLICENDSTFVLRQEKGSTLKVPKNGKWQKLPKTLPFKRK